MIAAVGDRRLVAVVCTHSHSDHVGTAPALAARYGATPTVLHPADAVLWKTVHGMRVHGMRVPDFRELIGGEDLTVAGTEVQVLHTPGRSPGSVTIGAEAPHLDEWIARGH